MKKLVKFAGVLGGVCIVIDALDVFSKAHMLSCMNNLYSDEVDDMIEILENADDEYDVNAYVGFKDKCIAKVAKMLIESN